MYVQGFCLGFASEFDHVLHRIYHFVVDGHLLFEELFEALDCIARVLDSETKAQSDVVEDSYVSEVVRVPLVE